MKKRIYLMIEIFRREADARIYFAVKAALKNYSVIIANKSDIWAKRNELKKGIVLFKSLGKTNLKLIRDLKKSGHKIKRYFIKYGYFGEICSTVKFFNFVELLSVVMIPLTLHNLPSHL